MKTRELGVVILPLMAVCVAAVSMGCNATSVGADKESTPAAVVVVTNVPPPGAIAADPTAQGSVPAAVAVPEPKSPRPAPVLPPEVASVVQLVESGAGQEVIEAYVGGSNARYDLSLDQILYLRDIGVSDAAIAAMMRRGSQLRDKDAEAAMVQTNLVAAVEQIKEGLAQGGFAPTNGALAETAPAPPEAAAAAPAPVPQATPVAVQATQVPVEAPQPVQQFYTSLSPYGTWYEVPAYGWVWRPTVVVVDRTWMPYRHGGRWLWTDCGWYWYSDYSWGWAPFHYGRWAVHPGLGWCWTPDSVWGPSWVTWRHGNGYVGWAPLPPHCGWTRSAGLTWYGDGISVGFSFGLTPSCYTFVPGRRFGNRNLAHHAVRGGEHDGAFRQSTVVNNVIHGDNNVIVNNGIGYNQVASLSRDEIPKARVQPLPGESKATLRADRMERSREGLVVYRPTEVEQVGGRPVLRSETRPASAAVSAPRSSGSRSFGAAPTRSLSSPGYAPPSRSGSLPPKAADTRGGAVGAPATTRPGPNAQPAVATGSPATARPYAAPTSSRGVEARGGVRATPVPSTSPVPTPTVTPRRETAPVPLGDPSRFLPRTSSGTPGARPFTAPTATPAPVSQPALSAPSRTSPGVSRPTVTTPSPALSRPMPSSSAPTFAPPPRPAYSAPSPAFSAPAPRPAYSAPSPSFNAPSRPTVSAPAPVAAPAPARPVPSGGPGAGSNPRNGSRNQVN